MNRTFQWVLVAENKYGEKLFEMFPHSVSPRPYSAYKSASECDVHVSSRYSQEKYAKRRQKELAVAKNFTFRLVDHEMNLIETWSLDGGYVQNSKVGQQDNAWSLSFTLKYADAYHQMNMNTFEALQKLSKEFHG
jgi:hypothetical protein